MEITQSPNWAPEQTPIWYNESEPVAKNGYCIYGRLGKYDLIAEQPSTISQSPYIVDLLWQDGSIISAVWYQWRILLVTLDGQILSDIMKFERSTNPRLLSVVLWPQPWISTTSERFEIDLDGKIQTIDCLKMKLPIKNIIRQAGTCNVFFQQKWHTVRMKKNENNTPTLEFANILWKDCLIGEHFNSLSHTSIYVIPDTDTSWTTGNVGINDEKCVPYTYEWVWYIALSRDGDHVTLPIYSEGETGTPLIARVNESGVAIPYTYQGKVVSIRGVTEDGHVKVPFSTFVPWSNRGNILAIPQSSGEITPFTYKWSPVPVLNLDKWQGDQSIVLVPQIMLRWGTQMQHSRNTYALADTTGAIAPIRMNDEVIMIESCVSYKNGYQITWHNGPLLIANTDGTVLSTMIEGKQTYISDTLEVKGKKYYRIKRSQDYHWIQVDKTWQVIPFQDISGSQIDDSTTYVVAISPNGKFGQLYDGRVYWVRIIGNTLKPFYDHDWQPLDDVTRVDMDGRIICDDYDHEPRVVDKDGKLIMINGCYVESVNIAQQTAVVYVKNYPHHMTVPYKPIWEKVETIARMK